MLIFGFALPDTNAGLIGPIVVTRRGWAREDGTHAVSSWRDRALIVLLSASVTLQHRPWTSTRKW